MDAGEIFATIKEPLSAVDYFLRLLIGVGLFIMIIHITVLILTSGNNYARREEAKEVAAYLIAGVILYLVFPAIIQLLLG